MSKHARIGISLLFLSMALVIGALNCAAQTNVGRISGTVTDATGAAVPACEVTAVNIQTGLRQTVKTEDTGFYVFPGLPVGSYDVSTERQGFKSIRRSGVGLDAASRRIVDFQLEVGAVTESVAVSAVVEQVQTASGDISRVIEGNQVSQLALNGRNYMQLLRLIPGVVATNMDPFAVGLSTTTQRINGVRSDSLYFTVDGADNMDNGANSNAIIEPNVDAIAEIKILTSSYSAEFGGRAGGVINVVTKSGTREFHGTLFEFVRNDRLDARSFFARGIDPLRFNDFGWTLGGPVFIPRRWNADKNKLFFFAGQEWKYAHQGQTQLGTVPTAGERTGDFRTSSLPAPVDPLNGQPFPNRTVPASRFSKNGPLLLKPYPLPNFGGPGGNYSATGVNRNDTREDLVKVDYILSSNTQLSYRWTHDTWYIWNAWQGSSLGIVPGARPRPGYTTMFSLNHTFSPTMLNYFSFSLTHNRIQASPDLRLLKRDVLGLTYPEIWPINMSGTGPNLSLSGFTSYTSNDRIHNANTTFQVRDDFTKVVGPHTLKFGVQITRSRKNENRQPADQGAVTFNTSAKNTTRNAVADVLLGNFQNYSEAYSDSDWWSRFSQYEVYAQDSWRVSRKLTLELGLRYNIIGPVYSALGNYSTFLPSSFKPAQAPGVNPSDGSLLPGGDPYNGIAIFGAGFPAAAKGRIPAADDPSAQRLFIGLPRAGFPIKYNAFGPRIGFAVDPSGRGVTAIRGGFGIFYDQYRTGFPSALSGNPPFSSTANIFDGNIDNPGGGTARNFPSNLTAVPTDMPTLNVMSFNLGVQQQLPGGMIVDASYVGTLGRNVYRTLNINQLRAGTRLNPPNSNINVNALNPYLGYGTISMLDNGDSSNYNSLQVSANRRLQRGISFGVSYTFSKTIDTTSGAPQDSYNARADYGLSAAHRAQVLNFNYVYDIPLFRKAGNRAVRVALGGWELAGVTSYQSGAPNNVTVPFDVARIGASSSRASVAGNPNLSGDQRTLGRWFNTEAFLPQERMIQGRFGDAGRNILIGPGFGQWDISLLKNFQVREKARLQFRAESFNTVNHPSFTGINATVRFDSAGKPTQNYGAVTGAGPGRVLAFGLKLIF